MFYRRKVKDTFEMSQFGKRELIQAFKDENLIKKYNDHKNAFGEEIFHLLKGKIESCVDVAKRIRESFWYVYENFPRNIRCRQNPYHECDDCEFRYDLISSMKDNYNIYYSHKSSHNKILSEKAINKTLKIKNKRTGGYRRLTQKQKKHFRQEQEILEVLDEHFRNRVACKKFWRKLLRDNNIPLNTFIMVLDHMGSITLGSHSKSKTTSANTLVPFGVVILYADPQTGETRRISRMILPDSISLTSWSVITCLKQLLRRDDPVLQDIIANKTNLIVISI